jgi:hypothetical protein
LLRLSGFGPLVPLEGLRVQIRHNSVLLVKGIGSPFLLEEEANLSRLGRAPENSDHAEMIARRIDNVEITHDVYCRGLLVHFGV